MRPAFPGGRRARGLIAQLVYTSGRAASMTYRAYPRHRWRQWPGTLWWRGAITTLSNEGKTAL
jgi:hypothetical protein